MTYPLNLACKHGCPTEAIKLLINAGADLNRRDKNEYSPLDYSYLTGEFQTFQLILESGASPELRDGLVFTMIRDKKIDYLKQLAKYDFDPDESLLIATEYGKHDIVKYLISIGANVDYWKFGTPLTYAINSFHFSKKEKGNLKCTKFLLESGADPNLWGEYELPLSVAIKKCDEEIIDLLLQYGAKINDEQGVSYALISAAREGHYKIIEKLLNLGANVNGTTETESPLFSAIQSGNIDVVRLLLDHGANVRHKIRRKGTAVDLAFKLGHIEMIKLMGKYV